MNRSIRVGFGALLALGACAPSDKGLEQGIGYETVDTLPAGARVVGLALRAYDQILVVIEHPSGGVLTHRLDSNGALRIVYRDSTPEKRSSTQETP